METTLTATQERQRKPEWLKIQVPAGQEYGEVKKIVEEHSLHT
ncbi:MAG: lipoyl synthase, partial [Bacteroidetes bacterium]